MIHIVFLSFKVLLIPELWHKLNHLPVVTKLVSLSWLIFLLITLVVQYVCTIQEILVFNLRTKYST